MVLDTFTFMHNHPLPQGFIFQTTMFIIFINESPEVIASWLGVYMDDKYLLLSLINRIGSTK